MRIDTTETLTNRELVDAANELAGEFYALHGCIHRAGFKYWESPHPQEQLCFEMAALAFERIRGSDVWDAIEDLSVERDENYAAYIRQELRKESSK